MSLGLGIFLSTLVLSTILLYRWTQDRWNWRKGLIRLGVVTSAIAAVGVGSIYTYDRYQNRLTRATGYYDLTLGMSKDEVYYVKGQPTEVHERPAKGDAFEGSWLVIYVNAIPKGKTPKDYISWAYSLDTTSGDRLDIEFFDRDRVSRIACYTTTGFCRSILGIASGDTEESVKDRLGKPDREELSGVTKRLRYSSLNLSLYLVKKKVYMLVVEGETPQ